MPLLTYTLNDQGHPVPSSDFLEWATWMALHTDRNTLSSRVGDWRVRTTFGGLDRGLTRGLPLLWETVLLEGAREGLDSVTNTARGEHSAYAMYGSETAAKEGHERAVGRLLTEELASLSATMTLLWNIRSQKNSK